MLPHVIHDTEEHSMDFVYFAPWKRHETGRWNRDTVIHLHEAVLFLAQDIHMLPVGPIWVESGRPGMAPPPSTQWTTHFVGEDA